MSTKQGNAPGVLLAGVALASIGAMMVVGPGGFLFVWGVCVALLAFDEMKS